MAGKFFGQVGYAGDTAEIPPGSGVWKDVIVEKPYYGDVLQNLRNSNDQEKVIPDLSLSSRISIVADLYAWENFSAIRYVRWMGARWKVTTIDPSTRPRLILSLGAKYDGPVPTA